MRYNSHMPNSTVSVPSPTPRVMIIRNAFVYDFGGGERFPVDLAVELRKLGFETTVVSRSRQLLSYAAAHDIPRIRGWWWRRQNWSGPSVLLFPVYLVWQLVLTLWYLQLIARVQPDTVHPQSKDDFIAATLAGRMLGKRVVWTDHADLKYVYQNHAVWYKNPVGKLVFAISRLAHAVTLVSQSEADLIGRALAPRALLAHYQVVYNGVTDTVVTPHKRAKDDRESFIFCATSRLVTAKGIGELLTAFQSLQAIHKDVRLWLVGDGPEAKTFQQHAGNVANIHFIGHQDKPLPYVAAADVFVHPSYHEGFSISLVEAAMLAKPIIACKVGGNPEIVVNNHTGLLVQPRDSQALFEAMQSLYENRSLAKQLAQNARKSYQASFQFDTIVAKQFVPLYISTGPTGERS